MPYGVVVDMAYAELVMTVIAYGDGRNFVLVSTGRTFDTQNQFTPQINEEIGGLAMAALPNLTTTGDVSIPPAGKAKFFVMVDGVVRSRTVALGDLNNPQHPLRPLFERVDRLSENMRVAQYVKEAKES